MRRVVLFAALAAAVLANAAGSAPWPDSYALPGSAVFPEGIAYDEQTATFYVGSTTDGTVFRGHLKDPTAEVFLNPGGDGRTTAIGMKVGPDDRLYIAGGPTGFVFVYEAESGDFVRRFASGAGGFLNDLAIVDGDAFVTDSIRPVLWRVPAEEVVAGAADGNLEPWLDFTGTPLSYQPGFNLNGIVASQDGRYLIVAQSNTGKLFRIEIATKTVQEIVLDEPVSADGLWLRGRTLFAVARPDIAKVELSGDLTSGHVVSRTQDPSLRFPTTIAIAKGRLLVVNSQFDKRGPGLSPELPFTVSSIPVP